MEKKLIVCQTEAKDSIYSKIRELFPNALETGSYTIEEETEVVDPKGNKIVIAIDLTARAMTATEKRPAYDLQKKHEEYLQEKAEKEQKNLERQESHSKKVSEAKAKREKSAKRTAELTTTIIAHIDSLEDNFSMTATDFKKSLDELKDDTVMFVGQLLTAIASTGKLKITVTGGKKYYSKM